MKSRISREQKQMLILIVDFEFELKAENNKRLTNPKSKIQNPKSN